MDMDWYEYLKQDIEELHDTVAKMWRSSLKGDILLITLIVVSALLYGVLSVLNFCEGGWRIVLAVYYIILMALMVSLGVVTVRRIRDTKERIRANELWYESELNSLNNQIKEIEDGCGSEEC